MFYKPEIAETLVTSLSLHACNERLLDKAVKVVRNCFSDFSNDDVIVGQQDESVPKMVLDFITKILLNSLHYSQDNMSIVKIQLCATLPS